MRRRGSSTTCRARGLELRFVSDDEDLRSYGFRHDVAFGGPPRPVQAGTASRPEPARVAAVSVSGDLGAAGGAGPGRAPPGSGRSVRFRRVAGRSRSSRGALHRRRLPDGADHAGTFGRPPTASRSSTRSPPDRPRGSSSTGIDLDARAAQRGWRRRGRSRPSTTSSGTKQTQIVRETLAADGYLQPAVNAQRSSTRERPETLSIMVERGSQTSTTRPFALTVRMRRWPRRFSRGSRSRAWSSRRRQIPAPSSVPRPSICAARDIFARV